MSIKKVACTHMEEGVCYMRQKRYCSCLVSTVFPDGICHFRKESYEAPNPYDQLHLKSAAKSEENHG